MILYLYANTKQFNMWRAFIICSLILVSCNNEEVKKETEESRPNESESLKDFFYPVNEMTAPETILYRSAANPLDEKYTHIFPMNESNDTAFIIEKFNRDLKLTEAFQLIEKGDFITVKKQRVASPVGVYDSKLMKKQFYPLTKDQNANFISHFPENDTLILVWDQLMIFNRIEKDFEHKDNKYDVAIFDKKVSIYRVNQNNGMEQKVSEVEIVEYWAKGVGLLKMHPKNKADNSIDYFKTLDQKEWSNLFNL